MIMNRLLAILIAILLVSLSLTGCKVPLEADFVVDDTEIVGSKKIQFTDLSLGNIRSWAWDFESDGIIDSTEQNPTHTYKQNKAFTVTLTITGSGGESSITKENYISVSGCNG